MGIDTEKTDEEILKNLKEFKEKYEKTIIFAGKKVAMTRRFICGDHELGVTQRTLRMEEIWNAMTRYYEASLPIPIEWLEEYNELIQD